MKVTISGTPGSGKSTTGKKLAKQLDYMYYDMGKIWRDLANKRGITLEALHREAVNDASIDREADQIVEAVGEKQDDFVFVARLAYHFIPDSLKVFLTCTLEEAARRIHAQKREEEQYATVEITQQKLEERMGSNKQRYAKLHAQNPYDTTQYDIVIDTTHLSKEEVVERIKTFV